MTGEQKLVKGFAIFLAVVICISIFSAFISFIGLLFSWTTDGVTDGMGITATEKITEKNIDKLDIDIGTLNLEIYRGEEFKIEKENLKSQVDIKVSGSTLKIAEHSHSFWRTKMGGTLIVYIPYNIDLTNLSIDMGAGTVTMENIKANKLDMAQGAGTIYMSKCEFQKTDIDGGVGKTTIKNSTLKDLDLDSGVGEIDIEAKILGKSEIDGGVGSINLDIIGSKDDYSLYIDKGLGSITVDGESVSGRIGSGSNNLDIDGGVGSIRVRFN